MNREQMKEYLETENETFEMEKDIVVDFIGRALTDGEKEYLEKRLTEQIIKTTWV